MSGSEDYLDHLLNNISAGKNDADTVDMDQEIQRNKKEDSSLSDDDFLKSFEQEIFEKDASDNFLKEFEKELEDDDIALMGAEDNQPLLQDIDGIVDGIKTQMGEGDNIETMDDMIVDTFEEDDFLGFETKEESSKQDDAEPGEEASDDFGLDMNLFGDEDSKDQEDTKETDAKDAQEEDDPFGQIDTEAEDDSDSDLMDLLNADSDLSDIGDMLQADDENIGLEDSDPFESFAESETEEILQESLGDLDLEGELEEPKAGKKPKKEKKAKKEKMKKTEDDKKQGFFAKLGKILFGEDEDETEEEVISITPSTTSIEELTDESLEILKGFGGAAAAAPEAPAPEEPEKKKKEKKEKKPKKEKAPKPKKEKKPKPPKVPDNTPPLPKAPVILIFVMAASILALVILGTNLVGYSNSFNRAQEAFDQADYAAAFQAVSGVNVKEDEAETYEKYRILALAANEYDAYASLYQAEIYDMALDSLIRTIGRCDKYREDANTYGCGNQLAAMETEAESILAATFGVTKEQALELYAEADREAYTIQIYEILQNAGLRKVTE